MPGLDYYGAEYDPYERGNPITSMQGFAIFGGAELAGSKFGLGGLAARQQTKSMALGVKAAALGRAPAAEEAFAQALRGHRMGTGPGPVKFGAGVFPAGAAENAALGRASAGRATQATVKGRAAALGTSSAANTKWARSHKYLGRAWGILGLAHVGYELGKAMFSVGGDFRIRKQDLAEQRRKVHNDDTFMDSRAAFTQRQRAIQVIHNSQMGVRSAMGSEASYLHY